MSDKSRFKRHVKVSVANSKAWIARYDPISKVVTAVATLELDLSNEELAPTSAFPTNCSETMPVGALHFPGGVDAERVGTVASYMGNEAMDAFLTVARAPDQFQVAVTQEEMLQDALSDLGGDLNSQEVAYCVGWLELANTFYPSNTDLRRVLNYYGSFGPTI